MVALSINKRRGYGVGTIIVGSTMKPADDSHKLDPGVAQKSVSGYNLGRRMTP